MAEPVMYDWSQFKSTIVRVVMLSMVLGVGFSFESQMAEARLFPFRPFRALFQAPLFRRHVIRRPLFGRRQSVGIDCRNFRCVRDRNGRIIQQPIRRIVRNNNNNNNRNNNGNNNGRIDLDEVEKNVLEFKRLALDGKKLLTKDRFGFVRDKLFLDRFGNLTASTIFSDGSVDPRRRRVTDLEVIRDTRDFFLDNLDKFSARQSEIANRTVRFLEKTGGLPSTLVTIDLLGGNVPFIKDPYIFDPTIGRMRKADRVDIALGTLNQLLSLLTNGNKFARVTRDMVSSAGTVTIDVRELLTPAQLGILSSNNAYSCTGMLDLGQMVNVAMDPNAYRQLKGFDDNWKDVTEDLGAVTKSGVDEFGNIRSRKIAYGLNIPKDEQGNLLPQDAERNSTAPAGRVTQNGALQAESRVGKSFRTVDYQIAEKTGNLLFGSADYRLNRKTGRAADARNPFKNPIPDTNTHDAQEFLGIGKNGMLNIMYLANDKDQFQAFAPAGIVENTFFDPHRFGAEIRAPEHCLGCHAMGFLGGDPGTEMLEVIAKREREGKFDQDNPALNSRLANFARQFYTSRRDYKSKAVSGSNTHIATVRSMGGFIVSGKDSTTAVALLPEANHAHNKIVTREQLARKMRLVNGADRNLAKFGFNKDADYIPRETLEGLNSRGESKFCELARDSGSALFREDLFNLDTDNRAFGSGGFSGVDRFGRTHIRNPI